jgi:excisionase family DNA binding protein
MLQEESQARPSKPTVRLMTPTECAAFLQVKLNTLYVLRSQGRIPYRKVGHLLRFDRDEIIAWTKPNQK